MRKSRIGYWDWKEKESQKYRKTFHKKMRKSIRKHKRQDLLKKIIDIITLKHI